MKPQTIETLIPALDAAVTEQTILQNRITHIESVIRTEGEDFKPLENETDALLADQLKSMQGYLSLLSKRIRIMNTEKSELQNPKGNTL